MSLSPLIKYRLNQVIRFAIFGGIIGVIFSFFTSANDLIVLFFVGFIGALLINSANQLINGTRLKRLPFFGHFLLRIVVYTMIIIAVVFSVVYLNYYITDGISIRAGLQRYYQRNIVETNDFIDGLSYAVISAVLLTFFSELTLIVGRGRILKYLSGKYHKPIEDERILMFLDVSSSTTIAEKIGHIKYSAFIKDFIYELHNAILLTEAEIIQYVGDELLLMWPVKKGVKDNNCVRMFFLAREQIARKKQDFIDKYGVYPQFKAGLHYGKMIIMEVGSLKKEIAHYGDSMNTAARIRSTCNEVNKELLISEKLLKKLKLGDEYKVEHLGPFVLKGKEEKVELAAIDKVG